ncbi:MAG: hypothetical protein Kow0077_05320 [Anaerolineae bacterium]
MARGKPAGRHKHIPQRTCVVCRRTMDKRALNRIVYAPDEGLVVDPTGKRNGRGAYLCDQPACWEAAASSPVLDRALRITLTPAERARLREQRPEQ